AAAQAIASYIPEEELSVSNLLPSALDRNVSAAVAKAVAEAARRSGVARA
ncbi:MAG: NAD-dependent malic enzyme, partial [Hydrogeniiclostridium sp.]